MAAANRDILKAGLARIEDRMVMTGTLQLNIYTVSALKQKSLIQATPI
jgi:hypothetical protein